MYPKSSAWTDEPGVSRKSHDTTDTVPTHSTVLIDVEQLMKVRPDRATSSTPLSRVTPVPQDVNVLFVTDRTPPSWYRPRLIAMKAQWSTTVTWESMMAPQTEPLKTQLVMKVLFAFAPSQLLSVKVQSKTLPRMEPYLKLK